MRKIIAILFSLIICTTMIGAGDDIYQRETIRNDEMIEYLYNELGYDYNTLNSNCVMSSYYTGFGIGMNMNRKMALIDLMRIYNLIPDPDEYANMYKWDDKVSTDDPQELAYINYAKYLGITKGTSATTFGFDQSITRSQLNTFRDNIKNLTNLKKYQYEYKFSVTDDQANKHYSTFCKPLIAEYYYTLPDYIIDRVTTGKWKIEIVNGRIPGVASNIDAIGATNYYTYMIYVAAETNVLNLSSFMDTFIHEFGHVLDCESNCFLSSSINNLYNDEIDKLCVEHRGYASKNEYEYIACAWRYMEIIGEEKYSEDYPLTYQLFLQGLNRLK